MNTSVVTRIMTPRSNGQYVGTPFTTQQSVITSNTKAAAKYVHANAVFFIMNRRICSLFMLFIKVPVIISFPNILPAYASYHTTIFSVLQLYFPEIHFCQNFNKISLFTTVKTFANPPVFV